MKEESANLFGIDDLDVKVYRVFKKSHFLGLLSDMKLVLVNPSKWDDPFENFFLAGDATGKNRERISLKPLRDRWYGQCWSFHKESDAMWRIYSHDKEGIKIQTTVRKLMRSFIGNTEERIALRFFAGKVEYLSRDKIENMLKHLTFMDLAIGGQNDGFAQLLCVKRPEFSHEEEMRILFYDSNGECGARELCRFAVNPQDLIEEVVIDPRMSSSDYSKLKQKISNMGCSAPILQSELYHITPIPIRIE